MDLPLFDSDDVPLPPGEVRLLALEVSPYPDRARVRVTVRLTPFLERPNLEIQVLDGEGAERAGVAVVEAMTPELGLTLHLRGPQVRAPLRLHARLEYPEHSAADDAEVSFDPAGPAARWAR